MGLFHPIYNRQGRPTLKVLGFTSEVSTPQPEEPKGQDEARISPEKSPMIFGVFAGLLQKFGEKTKKTVVTVGIVEIPLFVGFAKYHRSGGVGLGISLNSSTATRFLKADGNQIPGAMIWQTKDKKMGVALLRWASHGSFSGGSV